MLAVAIAILGWAFTSVLEPDPVAFLRGLLGSRRQPLPPLPSSYRPAAAFAAAALVESAVVETSARPAKVAPPASGFFLLALSLGCLTLGGMLLQEAARPRPVSIALPALEPLRTWELVESVVETAPLVEPVVEEAAPEPSPPPPPSEAPIQRVRIGSIAIDAAVVVLGVDPDGVMQSPRRPLEIGWYDFSSHPGFPGNAVFGGHVDFANFGPAIFYRLRQLQVGDEIFVSLEDATEYRYVVVSSESYGANSAPVEEIIGQTERESITLITCDGSFNTRTRQYDRRLVVRAERVP